MRHQRFAFKRLFPSLRKFPPQEGTADHTESKSCRAAHISSVRSTHFLPTSGTDVFYCCFNMSTFPFSSLCSPGLLGALGCSVLCERLWGRSGASADGIQASKQAPFCNTSFSQQSQGILTLHCDLLTCSAGSTLPLLSSNWI